MKKTLFLTLCLFSILVLTACGNASAPSEAPLPPPASEPVQEPAPETPATVPAAPEEEGGILTVFFSVPEDVSIAGVDAVSGAEADIVAWVEGLGI